MAPIVFYAPLEPGAIPLEDGWEYMVLPVGDEESGFTIRLVQVNTRGKKLRTGKMWIISPERIGTAPEAFARLRTGFAVEHPAEIENTLARLIAKGLLRVRVPDAN